MVTNSLKGLMRAPYNYNIIIEGQTKNSSISGSFYTSVTFVFQGTAIASNSPVSSNQLSTAIYMDVGFGDTAASADDIKLADGNMDIVSASGSSPYNHPLEGKKYLTIVGISNNSKVTNEIKNVTVVYRNDTQNTVTIKEVGMYVNPVSINSSYWGGYNQNYMFLAFRKVLTTPIVMAPGDVYAVTYRISLNM